MINPHRSLPMSERIAKEAIERQIVRDKLIGEIAVQTRFARIICCQYCFEASNHSGCGPNCIRGKTIKEANQL